MDNIECEDKVIFTVGPIAPIREDDIYGGYRVSLEARYDTIPAPLTSDVSTGDAITPHAVECDFCEILDDTHSFRLWAYNIETVLAEKIETILCRTVFSTSPRDYYVAFILSQTRNTIKLSFARLSLRLLTTEAQQTGFRILQRS